MNILGIDTSFLEDTAIGLYFSVPHHCRLEMHIKAPLSQEEKLLYSVNAGLDILKKSLQDIDVIAVGVGPGSFTGLRIGITTAKSIAWALKKRIVGLSSLELLVKSIPAALFFNKPLVIPLIDARLNKVFTALFEGGKRITEDYDIEPGELALIIKRRKNKTVIFLGDGLTKYMNYFIKIPGKDCVHIPGAVISGGAICDIAYNLPAKEEDFDPGRIVPVYLRKSEAEIRHTR